MQYDVIVVGAGISGLMAMRELRRAGLNVCVLEAGAVAGGRCATIQEPGFDVPVETGAEFIHANAKITFRLLKEASIHAEEVRGNMIPIMNGVWLEGDDQEKNFKKFSKAVSKLEQDQTLQQVLDTHFADDDSKEFREMVSQFAKGFCLADPAKISTRALLEEWATMDEKQYRIIGGYVKLVDFLLQSGDDEQTQILTRKRVHRVVHDGELVTVLTTDGLQYNAKKVIITVPLPVLQSGSITFEPELADQHEAWLALASGSVVKMIFAFREPFWMEKDPKAAFFLSNERIPTWWTHMAPEKNLLTGWLGGPDATEASRLTGDSIYEMALDSLASIFHRKKEFIREQLTHHKIICWDVHPFIRGGYSYGTIGAGEAKKILSVPVKHKIYFAGEALYEGYPQGTVEAALASGEKTARDLIMSL